MVNNNIEQFEQFGTIALVGLILAPGLAWIMRARNGASVAQRVVVVGTLIAGAVVLEAAMDRTANEVVSA